MVSPWDGERYVYWTRRIQDSVVIDPPPPLRSSYHAPGLVEILLQKLRASGDEILSKVVDEENERILVSV